MFTFETIVAINMAHSLVCTAEEFAGKTKPQEFHPLRPLTTSETALALTELAESAVALAERTLLEVLQATAPQFEGTPFAQTVAEAIAAYKYKRGDSTKLSARVALASVTYSSALAWLQAEMKKLSPLLPFRVGSAYGDFYVKAVDGYEARMAAAQKQYGEAFEEMDHNVLCNFALGVQITDEEFEAMN